MRQYLDLLQKLLDDDRVDVNVANSQSESVLFTAMGFITPGQIKILQAKQFILWNLKKGRSGGIALEEFCRLWKYTVIISTATKRSSFFSGKIALY